MTAAETRQWLASLSSGDVVRLHRHFISYRSSAPATVARTTKLFVVLEDGTRYRKRDGFAPRSSPLSCCWIRPEKPFERYHDAVPALKGVAHGTENT